MSPQSEVLNRAKSWLKEPYDEETKREVKRLIESDPQGLFDAFFQELSFGTGGIRAMMGIGTNRLNIYTIRSVTQGLANYLKKQPLVSECHSVFIGYDVRRHSKEFAQEAANVLASNKIRAFITDEMCPTPLVSYGCRHYRCSAAIMITASHNPPEYNGYKIYWSDGSQIVAPHDRGIIEQIRFSHYIDLTCPNELMIQHVTRELDAGYLSQLKSLQLYPQMPEQRLQILYTPLHGTGIRILPEALRSWGYHHIDLVDMQKTPDSNFTYAPCPNPEEPKALELGIEQLVREKKDLLLATDPDADRIGAVVLKEKVPYRLTGNQTACICLWHICTTLFTRKEFPPNAGFVKTIVTTELFRDIAVSFGGTCVDVLTGFKYIAEQIALWEKSADSYKYIFGAEESYGALYGTMVRDKDAISTACLIVEAASLAKKQKLTLVDLLYQIYEQYGVYRESLCNIEFGNKASGIFQMNAVMNRLRNAPPTSIAKIPVVSMEDFFTQKALNLQTNASFSLPCANGITLPKSDVISFRLADQTKLVIRPSGTEPKMKIYAEIVEKNPLDILRSIQEIDERLKVFLHSFQQEFVL